MAALEACLAGDVVLRGDGGGKAPALATSIVGRHHVARTLLAWIDLGRRLGGSMRPMTVNGGPGAVVVDADDRLVAVWALEMAGDEVTSVASIVNPDKLRHVGEVGGLVEMLSSARDERRGRR